jgi:HTH-type transcriptional regulator/antitoxin HigA
MELKLIKTKKEYNAALQRVDELFEAGVKKGTPKGNELELLLLLIEKYEDEHTPVDAPDPVEAIKFRMEQMNLKPKDLESIIGNKSLVSKVLNKKRSLSLNMIRAIHEKLKIPTDVLIQEYK